MKSETREPREIIVERTSYIYYIIYTIYSIYYIYIIYNIYTINYIVCYCVLR